MEGDSEKKQLSLYYLSNKYFLSIWVGCKKKVEIKKSIVKQLVLEGKKEGPKNLGGHKVVGK